MNPRRLYCVLERANRDLQSAFELAEGRFTYAGVTRALGTRPDWLSRSLPEDEEWRIEWWKFYFGLDLAHAFQLSDDEQFLIAWKELVASFIDQVPVGFDTSDVAARRVQNWVYAWERFGRATGFSGLGPRLLERMLRSLESQVRWIADHLSAERNHRTLELYALFIASLALPSLDPSGEILSMSVRELQRNLLEDVLCDGVHRERSSHYHMLALRSFLGFRENARRFGISIQAAFDRRLERACEFALQLHRPDGSIPMLSDSDGGSYLDLLELAADLFGRSDFLWSATAGCKGQPSTETSRSFPAGGYYVQRSGWGSGDREYAAERHLVFDCGPLGDGGHGHYDQLSIDLYAAGAPQIVDPGRYTYHEGTPNDRWLFKGTASHNTVCVDGLDQVAYRRGKPRGRLPEARLSGRWVGPGLDLLEGSTHGPSHDARHTRRVWFIDQSYWVIEDELVAPTPHRYQLRFQLTPAAWERVGLQHLGRVTRARSPGLLIEILGATRVGLERGWVSESYGHRARAPAIWAAVSGRRRARFVSLIHPSDAGPIAFDASLELGSLEANGAGSLAVRLESPEGEIIDRLEREACASGGRAGSGHATWTRARRGMPIACARAIRVEA